MKFPTHDGLVHAVSDLTYTVEMGKTLGIVGESGSGKSVSSMAVLGLHDIKRTHLTGSIRVGGKEIVGASTSALRKIRGTEVAMIFQDALSALHPFYHRSARRSSRPTGCTTRSPSRRPRSAPSRCSTSWASRSPTAGCDDYPHQFSGGMRQRAMIAMSLVNNPRLLIADEPTTALDVTVQAQILDLIQELQKEFGSAVVMITHDLGVIAEIADDVLVMYAGRCVEKGTCKQLLTHPEMPYTWGLLGSSADVAGDPEKPLVPIPGTPPSLLSTAERLLVPPAVRPHATRWPAAGASPSFRSCVRVRQPGHFLRVSPDQPGGHLRERGQRGDRVTAQATETASPSRFCSRSRTCRSTSR